MKNQMEEIAKDLAFSYAVDIDKELANFILKNELILRNSEFEKFYDENE